MKVIISVGTLFLMLGLFSCKKEEIPTPVEVPKLETPPALWISGEFDSTFKKFTVEGEKYEARTFLVPAQPFVFPPAPALWNFELYATSEPSLPLIRIIIVNHEFEVTNGFADLVTTIDTNALSFLYFQDPDPLQLNRILIDYIPDIGTRYSSVPVINNPVSITENKDTLVNSQSFRIITLEGDLALGNVSAPEVIEVKKFKARIALGL